MDEEQLEELFRVANAAQSSLLHSGISMHPDVKAFYRKFNPELVLSMLNRIVKQKKELEPYLPVCGDYPAPCNCDEGVVCTAPDGSL